MSFLFFAYGEGIPVQSLENASVENIADIYKGQEKVALIFQPDCHSCKEQVNDLACFKQPIFLVGAFHHRKSLQKEYLKMKTSYPAYQSSKELLAHWQIKEDITPQILVLDEKGAPKKKIIGSKPCIELKTALNL